MEYSRHKVKDIGKQSWSVREKTSFLVDFLFLYVIMVYGLCAKHILD